MTSSQTPEEWARIEERFHQIREAAAGERTVLLARLAAEDPALAAEVRALLAAENAGPVGDTGLRDHDTDLVAEFVGPYRLLRRLGEGGMGTVYLAEREEGGFRQRVALKLLRAGFMDPRLAEQAAHERRVLARLEHPNIARLIDGGSTPSGQPYLAMEYVEGGTLLDHCTGERLTVPGRLRLFIEICEAVQYAHQQLVVHRDLKPGNLVVGPDGRPRLLDFGISKLVDRDAPTEGGTASVLWITPAYASPEQFRGRSVGTLSDVYSLGVILYQLLAGTRPYEVDGKSPAELERLICEVMPPAPSHRSRNPVVARELRGDLDTIVLKALAKDPARRYASAEQLAEDLRRYLAGHPVMARPDSVSYRMRKFTSRHRAGVAVVVVAVVLVLSAIIMVSTQARIARDQRDQAEAARSQAEEVTQYLIGLFDSADPSQAPVDTAAGRALLRQGLLQAEALSDQPELQAKMFDALGMIFESVGQYDRAIELVTRALDLRKAHLRPDHPDLAVSLSHLGQVQRGMSRYREAEASYHQALDLRLRALGPRHPDVAASYRDLGFLMPYLSRLDETLRYYEQALALDREVLGEDHIQTAADLSLTGSALARLGRNAESLALLREALARYQRLLGPDDPETARMKFHVADRLAADGGFEEAERLYREGIDSRRRVLGPDDIGMIHGLSNLAEILGNQGRGREAEALLRESVEIRRRQLGEHSVGFAGIIEELANELRRQGRYTEALALRRQGLAIWIENVGPEHAAVAGSMASQAELLADAGRYKEALALARQAHAMRVRIYGPTGAAVGLSLRAIGEIQLKMRNLAEAEASVREGLAILMATQPANSPDLRRVHGVLADILEARGNRAEAQAERALAAVTK